MMRQRLNKVFVLFGGGMGDWEDCNINSQIHTHHHTTIREEQHYIYMVGLLLEGVKNCNSIQADKFGVIGPKKP